MDCIEKISCDLAFMYDGSFPTFITTLVICIIYGFQSSDYIHVLYGTCAILALTFILHHLVTVTKTIFKNERPCQIMKAEISDCCPNNYDIPSGHTALGIFHGLILYYSGYQYLSIFFFIQPILRYIGKQHSIDALALGGVYGIIFYSIFTYLSYKDNM